VIEDSVIVIGSGPSGAQAAKELSERGVQVTMIDVGFDDAELRSSIPAGTFEELRANDSKQARYFLGSLLDEPEGRVGAQLTPPRKFITRDVDDLTPAGSQTFFPMRSLALGGLGAGWGAGAFTFTDVELERVGLPPRDIVAMYQKVAADIGVSANLGDDIAEEIARLAAPQRPLELDSNAESLMRTYRNRSAKLRASGLVLGQTPLAVLSEPLNGTVSTRAPSDLDDMDFYRDTNGSVYRPRLTIEQLKSAPGFRYVDRHLALRFADTPEGVEVTCRDLRTNAIESIRGRRLLLAAGALGTMRLVLRSLGTDGSRLPVLCNPYAYIACVNLAMFGRPARDRRHSLSQLTGIIEAPGYANEKAMLSFYSYRSLLLFKIVKEMPIGPRLGVLLARTLISSLTVIGLHFSDEISDQKWIAYRARAGSEGSFDLDYRLRADERSRRDAILAHTVRSLRKLSCVAFGTIEPGFGSSIHYAGGMRQANDPVDRFATKTDGSLHAAPHVFVADSANWAYLPAKGLTLTLMANARRVAAHATASLAVS